MVDLGPLDGDALRALIEAVKFGKSLLDSDADPQDAQNEGEESTTATGGGKNEPQRHSTPSDINYPSIGPAGIIGSLTVNNLYFDTTGRKLEMNPAVCCHDYPDGLCPHRRNRD